jgi:6-phosphogluconolactonase/glucosamine-6-phosphate isomerase/deaminase
MRPAPVVVEQEALASEGADWVARALVECLAGGRRVSLALSGGGTPGPMYRELARRNVPWARVDFYFVDERFVPPDHPESNYLLA